MNINVIYFASLREEIGRDQDFIQIDSPITTAEAWTQATGRDELPEKVLIAVNHEYVSVDTMLKEGDELAFFPPVTGG